MARRSRVGGVSKLRKTLRRVDSSISDGVRGVIRDGAQAITADAIQHAPRDEGDLVRSIDYKLGRDGLTAVIGPGAKAVKIAEGRAKGNAFKAARMGAKRLRLSKANKALFFQFFKGYWIEYGTKGKASLNIPPLAARPFMEPAWDLNRAWLVTNSRKAVRNALERAARG